MDGIQRKVGITVLKRDANDNQVVDMIEVLSKTVFGDVWMHATNDQVSGCANSNLICNMAWKNELAIVPGEFNLQYVRTTSYCGRKCKSPAFHGYKCHFAWHSLKTLAQRPLQQMICWRSARLPARRCPGRHHHGLYRQCLCASHDPIYFWQQWFAAQSWRNVVSPSSQLEKTALPFRSPKEKNCRLARSYIGGRATLLYLLETPNRPTDSSKASLDQKHRSTRFLADETS